MYVLIRLFIFAIVIVLGISLIPRYYNNTLPAIVVTSQTYDTTPPPSTFVSEDQVQCLVKNAYHEARGEGEVGVALVTKVVQNRVNSTKYPNTFCEVVYQPNQFSWTLNKSKLHYKIPAADYNRIRITVIDTLDGVLELPKELENADHYTRNEVRRVWMKDMVKAGSYGNHKFFVADNSHVN